MKNLIIKVTFSIVLINQTVQAMQTALVNPLLEITHKEEIEAGQNQPTSPLKASVVYPSKKEMENYLRLNNLSSLNTDYGLINSLTSSHKPHLESFAKKMRQIIHHELRKFIPNECSTKTKKDKETVEHQARVKKCIFISILRLTFFLLSNDQVAKANYKKNYQIIQKHQNNTNN